jgi:RNA polymerase sigma-32 factor
MATKKRPAVAPKVVVGSRAEPSAPRGVPAEPRASGTRAGAAPRASSGRAGAKSRAATPRQAVASSEREAERDDDVDGFSSAAEDGRDDGDEVAATDGEPRHEQDEDSEVLEGEVVDDDELEPEAERELDEEPSYDLPAAVATRDTSVSLTRYDALQAYMRDVHRYSVLDPEAQRLLAVRYREEGDVDAARQLVTSNLRLVVKIAYDYRRAYRNVMDLIQEGNIGLMQAVKKYDPYKGVKLSSYAAWWIRAYILRFILNNWRLVKLGTTQAQRKLFFNLSKEKARLSAMGIEPTAETIAANLDVSVDDVNSMDRRLSAGEMSLDTPVAGDESKSQSRVDLMPALGERVDQLLADEEIGQLLHDEMKKFGETLIGKERQIFYERLMAEDPRTLQELGADFGVSRERVRQLEKRLQGRLKKYLEDTLGNELLEP